MLGLSCGVKERGKGMTAQKIRVSLKSYDHKLLDKSTAEIVDTVRRTGASVAGPIPLPTRINRYTVLRSIKIRLTARSMLIAVS
jgi:small subunit ribosomal protein S10